MKEDHSDRDSMTCRDQALTSATQHGYIMSKFFSDKQMYSYIIRSKMENTCVKVIAYFCLTVFLLLY